MLQGAGIGIWVPHQGYHEEDVSRQDVMIFFERLMTTVVYQMVHLVYQPEWSKCDAPKFEKSLLQQGSCDYLKL